MSAKAKELNVVAITPKIGEQFLLNDTKIENKIKFKIFEDNTIGFSFQKHEIIFDVYVAEHTGEGIAW